MRLRTLPALLPLFLLTLHGGAFAPHPPPFPTLEITHPPPSFRIEDGEGLEVACEVHEGGDEVWGGPYGVRIIVDGEEGGMFPIDKGGRYTFKLPALPLGTHLVQLQLLRSAPLAEGEEGVLARSSVSFTTTASRAPGDGSVVAIELRQPAECEAIRGHDIKISVRVTGIPLPGAAEGAIVMQVNGHSRHHPLMEELSMTIAGMPKGLHSVVFRVTGGSGEELAATPLIWVSTGGELFTFESAEEKTAGLLPAIGAPAYHCAYRHTHTMVPALWVLAAQAGKFDRAVEYTSVAVSASPSDGRFWAYHASALYLRGVSARGSCPKDVRGGCYDDVVASFMNALKLGVGSVEAGGVGQEMAGSLDVYGENDLSVGIKSALLSAECGYNRDRFGHNLRVLKEGECGERCVVIFARQLVEELDDPWGPSKLKRGMGGANEAVVFVSRELVGLGYKVEVYGNPAEVDVGNDEYGVGWYPFWTYDDVGTRPGVFVAWWHHQDAVEMGRRAGQRYMWFHYRQYAQRYTERFAASIDGAFAMSRYHANQMPPHAQNKTIVSGNGLDPKMFRDGINSPERLIYASHPFYGLRTLLRAWPTIHKELPEATLEIYYGWTPGMLKHIERVGQQGLDFKREVDELLKAPGILNKGMVGQGELTEALAGCGFYLYPCEIGEISSISLMRAQAMGAIPISSRHLDSALNETAGAFDLGPDPRPGLIGQDAEWVEEWVSAIVDAVKRNAGLENHRRKMKEWARAKFTWGRVAKHWDLVFSGGGAIGDIDDLVPLQGLKLKEGGGGREL